MSRIHHFLWAIIPLVICSCDSSPSRFTEPLPPAKQAITSFGNRIQGEFENKHELVLLDQEWHFAIQGGVDTAELQTRTILANVLSVSETEVNHRYELKIGMSFADAMLDSGFHIDSVKKEILATGAIFKQDTDSFYAYIKQSYPIFKIDSENILKKHRGVYFMNKKYEYGHGYLVQCLYLDGRNNLVLAELSTENQEYLSANFPGASSTTYKTVDDSLGITEPVVEVEPLYTLSETQFKDLMKRDFFNQKFTFKRIR